MTRTMILKEALRLPTRARADVAAELLASLEEEESSESREEVEKAWAREIERRARRVLSGSSDGRPWEEVRKSLEERFPRK